MRGVTFNGKHSYWDWGLILNGFPVVSPPEPKTKIVEVPGSDAAIDLSEVLTGKVHYNRREIMCHFTLFRGRKNWTDVYTQILNHLHGKEIEIILDDENEYFYTGRAKIDSWQPGQYTADVIITAEVEPYKTARFIKGKKVL